MLGKDSLECFESYGALSLTAFEAFVEGCHKAPFYSIFVFGFYFIMLGTASVNV